MNNFTIILFSLTALYFVLIGSIMLILFFFKKTKKALINAIRKYMLSIFEYLFYSYFIYLIIGFIVANANLFSKSYEDRIISNETEKEIVSLNLTQSTEGYINGGFILGYGYVDGRSTMESYYYFYTKENDLYKLEKVNAEGTLIKETDEEEPKIIYI